MAALFAVALLLALAKEFRDIRRDQLQGLEDAEHPGTVDSEASVTAAAAAPPAQAGLLEEEWCDPEDKRATGWAHLTDAECMRLAEDAREASAAAVRRGVGTLLFKHVHKAGGTTLCHVAQRNMVAEDVNLPFREDWTTNCVPFESFLGPHPAVGATDAGLDPPRRRRLLGTWLGGACFFGFLTPAQLRALPHHYRPLTFIAAEGPLPDALPLDAPFSMVTMLRNPLDRVVSSYRWWQYMMGVMPAAPAECHAYAAPANASFAAWLRRYPGNWMTRELAGREALYRRDAGGRPAPLTPSDVRRAKRRLHYYAAILVMERMEDSQLLLQQRFGWEDVDFEGHRAGSRRGSSAAGELAPQPEVLMALRQANRHDMEVYEYALALHERQVTEARGAAWGGGSSGAGVATAWWRRRQKHH